MTQTESAIFIAFAIAMIALPLLASFLLGSIPFGLVISRVFYRTDIRKSGSGNIGAMNALRTLGKGGAVAVLLLDAAKGFIPTALISRFGMGPFDLHWHSTYFVVGHVTPMYIALCGALAVTGHCFSPWLHWKGGKGVATSLGVIFAMSWQAGLVCVAAYLIAVAITRYSSVGSMSAHVVAPFALYFFTHEWAYAAYGVFALILIVWAHRENIDRLRAGTESAISLGSKRP
jgi:glycerol-3-phosphate acyltransferase PlsY